MRSAVLGIGVVVLGCATDPGDGWSTLSGAASGAPAPGETGESTGDDGDDESEAEEEEDEEGDDDDDGGETSDEGGAVDSSEGASSSDGAPGDDDGGDPGLACAGAGDLSMPGPGGAVPASQNCPQTDFAVMVAGSPGPIADVDVSIDAIAANTSQNRVWLVAPDQTTVLLFDHRGTFLTDDFVGTRFDDQSAMPVSTAPGPFHGCFAPEQSLAVLNGKDADGQWTLRVETCLYETSITGWQLDLDF